MSSESAMAAAVKAKADAAGPSAARILPFLSPEVCADSSRRVLYNNANVRASCPVYQKGITESGTIDVGDHQNRGILVVPHQACPILFSHASLSGVCANLFTSTHVKAGRLCSEVKGFYAGNDTFVPPYRAFEVPSRITLAVGERLTFPIHGGFYTTNLSGNAAHLPVAQVQFRDFTEYLSGGVGIGTRMIPAANADVITIQLVAYSTTVWAAGDLQADVVTLGAAGARVVTSGVLSSGALTNAITVATSISLPAATEGIASISIRNASAIQTTYSLLAVNIVHNCSANQPGGAGYVSGGLGTYVGGPISGISSLAPVTSAARLTMHSLKVTNTASALNANGFIIGMATQDCTPASSGCYGENTIAGLTGSKSFKFIDGSYMALAPKSDLQYAAIDSGPSSDTPMGLYIIQTQDTTPITFKAEYHCSVEVVSQDPLFAPLEPLHDVDQLVALGRAASGPGALLLCENPLHWGDISHALGKAAKFAVGKTARGIVTQAANMGLPGAKAVQSFQSGAAQMLGFMQRDPRPKNRWSVPALDGRELQLPPRSVPRAAPMQSPPPRQLPQRLMITNSDGPGVVMRVNSRRRRRARRRRN